MFLVFCRLGRSARWKDQLTLSIRISKLYIRCVQGTEPIHIIIVGNSDSDEDACSDLDDDCVIMTVTG